jgi:hypothetical protein
MCVSNIYISLYEWIEIGSMMLYLSPFNSLIESLREIFKVNKSFGTLNTNEISIKILKISSLINIIYLHIINGTQSHPPPLPPLPYPTSRTDRLPDLRMSILHIHQFL